jgi:Tol biopolymer transport system component
MANDQFGIAYRYIDNKYRSIDVWNKMKYEVGNVTFSNDADSIAFEAVNTIVSWGKIPKKLFVADMPFKSLQYAIRNEGIGELSNIIEIKPSADGAKYLVNPKWQPNGKLIAFDVVYDTQRQVWLFDTTTHVSSLLSANEYLTPETNSENAIPSAIGSKYTNMSMRVLDWSPDGSMLAVAIQMDNSKSDNGPVIIFNSTHKEMYYGSSLIQSGCIVNACFSLDNKMFATLRVPNPDYNIGSVDKYNILIRNIGTGKTDKIVQIPRGLRPLDIDW